MSSWLERMARRVRRAWNVPDADDAPRDPYSGVRHPLAQRPGGRNAAVALEEPDEDENLRLISHH